MDWSPANGQSTWNKTKKSEEMMMESEIVRIRCNIASESLINQKYFSGSQIANKPDEHKSVS